MLPIHTREQLHEYYFDVFSIILFYNISNSFLENMMNLALWCMLHGVPNVTQNCDQNLSLDMLCGIQSLQRLPFSY